MTAQVDPAALAIHLEALAHAALLAVQDLRLGLGDLGQSSPDVVMPNGSELLTAAQVAGLLGVGVRTLRRMRHAGRAPKPVRGSGPLRWRRADVEQWLQERAA